MRAPRAPRRLTQHGSRRRADNDSTDSPLTELQPLIDRGIVTYIPWPGEKGAAQGRQLGDCFHAKRAAEVKWMAGIDIGAPASLRARASSHPRATPSARADARRRVQMSSWWLCRTS